MTDSSHDPRLQQDSVDGAHRAAFPGMPRWVKVSVIVVAALVLAWFALMLILGGDHGPSRHAAGDVLRPQIAAPMPCDEAADVARLSAWSLEA